MFLQLIMRSSIPHPNPSLDEPSMNNRPYKITFGGRGFIAEHKGLAYMLIWELLPGKLWEQKACCVASDLSHGNKVKGKYTKRRQGKKKKKNKNLRSLSAREVWAQSCCSGLGVKELARFWRTRYTGKAHATTVAPFSRSSFV